MERLDIVPAQFRVLVVRRPKYACRACQNVVVQAPAPARLIEGGLPTDATAPVPRMIALKRFSFGQLLRFMKRTNQRGRRGLKL